MINLAPLFIIFSPAFPNLAISYHHSSGSIYISAIDTDFISRSSRGGGSVTRVKVDVNRSMMLIFHYKSVLRGNWKNLLQVCSNNLAEERILKSNGRMFLFLSSVLARNEAGAGKQDSCRVTDPLED